MAASPRRILEISRGTWMARVLTTAAHFEVFALLDESPRTAEEIAQARGLSVRGVEILAQALVGMGFLELRGDRYSNAATAAEFLVPGKPRYQGWMLAHQHEIYTQWAHLPEAVRTGKPAGISAFADPDRARRFASAMQSSASLQAPGVVKVLPLEGVRRFLDVGGGPGRYSVEVCLRHPEVEATILDLPGTIEGAQPFVAASPARARIYFQACDIIAEDSLGEGYDAALLSNIIHMLGPEQNLRLLEKIARALRPRGMVFVYDHFLNAAGTRPRQGSLFSVNMLMFTEAGKSYPMREYRHIMREAGFGQIEARPTGTAPRRKVLIGRKRDDKAR